jgi:hypothetical protein
VIAGSDPEKDPLTFDVLADPPNGILSGDPPNLTYTPDPGFSGIDSLEFTVWNGEYTSDPAEVTIFVRPEGATAPNILFVIMDDVGMDTSSQMHPGLIEGLTAQYGPQGHNHPFYGGIDADAEYAGPARRRVHADMGAGVLFAYARVNSDGTLCCKNAGFGLCRFVVAEP